MKKLFSYPKPKKSLPAIFLSDIDPIEKKVSMCGYTTLLDPIRYDIQLEDIKKTLQVCKVY